MQEFKSSANSRLPHYASEFKDLFTSDCEVLFCQARRKSIVIKQGSQVTQYLSGSKHTAAVVDLIDRPGRQFVLGESSATSSFSRPSKFATDLCKAFVSADIPL
jgi:hypothetical protein